MIKQRACLILVFSLMLLVPVAGHAGEDVGPVRPSATATAKPKPGSVQDLYNQGVAKGMQGKYQEAADYFRKATELDPRHLPSYNGWGIVLASLGRYSEAIEKFKKAASLDPSMAKVQYNWANALASMGKNKEAAARYKKATGLDPRLAPAYSGWGMVLTNLGRYDEAIVKFRMSAILDPHNAARINDTIKKIEKMKADKARKKPAGAPK